VQNFVLHDHPASFDRLRMRESLGGIKKEPILSLSKDAHCPFQPAAAPFVEP
jgi:hypothetical protein